MRVIVCGGRDFAGDAAWNLVMDTLSGIHAETPITTVIEGGASGADRLGRYWAQMRQIPAVTVPALWSEHGRAAGPIRNQRMLDDFQPDLVAAFPGGRGTADMVRRAEAAGVPVRRAADSRPAALDL